MNFSQVNHDVVLEDHVVLINNTQLAGHVYVEHHALLMVNSMVHQYCRIGAYSGLAPGCGTRQDIPPFGLFMHQPAQFVRVNTINLQRNGLEDSSTILKKVFTLLYREKLPLVQIEEKAKKQGWIDNTCVQQLLSFIRTSERGVSRAHVGDKS